MIAPTPAPPWQGSSVSSTMLQQLFTTSGVSSSPTVPQALFVGICTVVILRRVEHRRGQCCLRGEADGTAGDVSDTGTMSFGVGRRNRKNLTRPPWGPQRVDLFLQLPFENGVLLSGMFAGEPPQIPMLPPPASVLPPLAIVPVLDRDASACVRFEADGTASTTELRRQLAAGPLRASSNAGRALQRVLLLDAENFRYLRDYELLRLAMGESRSHPTERAEILLLGVYHQLQVYGGGPPRPSASNRRQYESFAASCTVAVLKGLEKTCSADFCLIAKAHVLGLAQSAPFPRLSRRDARSMYAGAMRFGHALRQTEIRFQADSAAGTFIPLSLETQMIREDLEASWAQPSAEGVKAFSQTTEVKCETDFSEHDEDDLRSARKSLQEALARLRRLGEDAPRPGLATYLGWLGKFDAEALTLLSTPAPVVEHAMRLQVDAVWGNFREKEGSPSELIGTTPSDMLEAIIFGAWLRDAAQFAEDTVSRHQQFDNGRLTGF